MIWEVDGTQQKVWFSQQCPALEDLTKENGCSFIAKTYLCSGSYLLTSRHYSLIVITVNLSHWSIVPQSDPFSVLFYILTEGSSSIHFMLGFFSKVKQSVQNLDNFLSLIQEKLSYDDYNLACIMTLPPHHRQGFGTLMIEFSKISSGRPAWLNSSMSQAMNYHEEQVKLVHLNDHSQTLVSVATFSFGCLISFVSSGRENASHSLSLWSLKKFWLQLRSLCSSPRIWTYPNRG